MYVINVISCFSVHIPVSRIKPYKMSGKNLAQDSILSKQQEEDQDIIKEIVKPLSKTSVACINNFALFPFS